MKDSSAELLVGIIIFIILILFIVVIIAALYATSPITVTPNPNYQTGRFLAPCTASTCNTPLICDGVSFTCRLPSGSPCIDYTDCATGLICSGRCTDGPTGGPGQFCPCNPGYLCVPDPSSGYTICLGAGDTPCGTGEECVSGVCDNGFCLAGAPVGYPCKQDLACDSGNCSLGRTGATGYCQAEGITTGTVGAACNDTPCLGFTGGVMGAPCLGTLDAPLECFCTTPGVAGVCITESQGILSTCSPFSACIHDLLVCYGTGGISCTDSTQSCACFFNYNNPNEPIDGACIPGMEAVGTVCLNSSGLGCSLDSMCASQNCGGASVMAFYQFTDPTTGLTDGVAFPGAITASILPAFPGPAFGPTVSPYKMFGISNGPLDTIYLVDHVQGFLSIDYNPSTRASTEWTQHFPYLQTSTIGTSTSQKTLIDVGFNDTTFLVAFNEILTDSGTGPTGNNDTVYTWDGNNFTLYNFQAGSGIPGTQYENGTNRPLQIDYLDLSGPNALSPGNDVLIAGGTGTTSGNVFVLDVRQGATKYTLSRIAGGASGIAGTPMVNLVGPIQFYFNDTYNSDGTGGNVCGATAGNQNFQSACPSLYNIAFGGTFRSFQSSGSTPAIPDALQFSGSVAGIGLPLDPFGKLTYRVYDYSIYSPRTSDPPGMTGMTFATIVILASAYQGTVFLQNVVALSYQGATTILPYNVSSTDRCVATANGFYILSRGSCA